MGRPLPWLPVLLVLLPAAAFAGERCPLNVSRPAPENAYLVGDVLWAGEPKKKYRPAAYRPVPGGGYVLCTCQAGACLRKCCPQNWTYDMKGKCSALNASLGDNFKVPEFVNETGTVDAYETGQIHVFYEKLRCYKKYLMVPSLNKTNNFRITIAGWLLNEFGDIIAAPGQFCMDSFPKFNFQTLPVICYPVLENKAIDLDMIHIGNILSLPFLFSTFLVYALIRDLRNLHGKSLMCHIATLFVEKTIKTIRDLGGEYFYPKWCIFSVYAYQSSSLASVFWLNVMCFDLWRTFSTFRPLRRNIQEHEAKKFIIYSIYAWGSTALIRIFTFGMEKYSPFDAIRPDIDIRTCWNRSFSAAMLYFNGPISILLFSNLLMFIHTAIIIVKHMRYARVLSGSESQKNMDHEKGRFMMYLKLFIVMGVGWSTKITLAWVPGLCVFPSVCYVISIVNSLYGVWIFLIVVCKKRVLNLLNKQLCPRFQFFKTSTASTRITNITTPGTSSNAENKYAVEMSTNC